MAASASFHFLFHFQYNFDFTVSEADTDPDGTFWTHREGKEISAPDRTEGEYRKVISQI
jgi:hypothetical protein